MTTVPSPTDRPTLFEWQHLLSIAMARGVMPAKRAAVAMLIALDSRGTTGEDARVNDGQIALELGMHSVTVWRHVRALSEAGWLERVSAAVGAAKGKPGRRAVYRLTIPTLDLMGKGLPTDVDNPESSSATTPDDATRPVDNSPDLVLHETQEIATRPPVDNRSRLAFPTTSSSATTPDDAALPPSTDLRLSTPLLETCTNDGREPVDKTSRSELVAEARAAIRRSA